MIHSSSLHNPTLAQARDFLAGWQRSRAELDNFRKRVQANQAEQQDQHLRLLLDPLLGLNDNFRAMLDHVPAELMNHPWVSGAQHIARQLSDILAQWQVSVITPQNSLFDPLRHEAIEHVKDTNVASGTVIEVVQAGYQRKGKVLRPAKVKVAA